jgi:glycosyltransferase involved in cell wall biosynthesis
VRIGILDCSSPHWTAGEIYTRTLLAALDLAEKPDDTRLFFLRSNTGLASSPGFEICDVGPSPGVHAWLSLQESLGLDVVLPMRDCTLPARKASVGWIPDFQHLHLPHLFTPDELRLRDTIYGQLASACQRVMVSSRSVARDFENIYPEHRSKVTVLPFPSLFAGKTELPDVGKTVEKYQLPANFALIPNQFWSHKNHAILPAALAALRDSGNRLSAVLTGAPADYRDPSNRVLSDFFQAVARHGVHDDVFILGSVSRPELLDLLRSASLIIQPSLSEGWNTTLEDAKALGVSIVCSDLAVHREQCGESAFYFDPSNPRSLADILLRASAGMVDVHETRQREAESLERARLRMKEWGEGVLRTAIDAANRPRSRWANFVLGAQIQDMCRRTFGKIQRAAAELRK